MRLNRQNLVVRWAFLFSPRVPTKVTLCELIWRVAIGTPLVLLCLGGTVSVFAFWIWEYPWEWLVGVGIVGTVLGAITGLVWMTSAYDSRGRAMWHSTLLYQAYKAHKERWCPWVEIHE